MSVALRFNRIIFNLVVKDWVQPDASFNMIVCFCRWNTSFLFTRFILVRIKSLIDGYISLFLHGWSTLRLFISQQWAFRVEIFGNFWWIFFNFIFLFCLISPACLIEDFNDLPTLISRILIQMHVWDLDILYVFLMLKSLRTVICADYVAEFGRQDWFNLFCESIRIYHDIVVN